MPDSLTRHCALPVRWVRKPLLAVVAAGALLTAATARAYDLSVRSGAVDQPRINLAVAPAGSPNDPFVGQAFDPNDPLGDPIPSIQLQAFYDTGASGIVLSEAVADSLGIAREQANGQPVVFSDISPGGRIDFHVSEPLVLRLADSLGLLDSEQPRAGDLNDPANFTTIYDDAFSPIRTQIGPPGGIANPLLGDLNVVGMPAMQGKLVVMDARPTNNALTLIDADAGNDNFDAFMRTYIYDAANPPAFTGAVADPGVPQTNVSLSLSYADFSRFTDLDPATAQPPTLAANPFIGPNPLLPDGSTSDLPPVTLRHGGQTTQGSFLLDTGAAASFLSTGKAAEVGVSYDPAHPMGSADPQLLGVPLDRQFTLALSGIGGETMQIAGFYADSLTLPTDQADPNNPDDPNNLHYQGAPVLVFNVDVKDPDTGEMMTLDGVLGMNYLLASADLDLSVFPPLVLDSAESPFDWIVFDQPGHKLRLALANPVPEPTTAGALLTAASLALLRRRRGPKGSGVACDTF